jgi:hypothetical protein
MINHHLVVFIHHDPGELSRYEVLLVLFLNDSEYSK